MPTTIRLCESDQEKFKGPQEVLFDWSALDDLPFDDLDEIERTIGMTIPELRVLMPKASARVMKAVTWIARRLAGQTDDWAAFNIRTRKIVTGYVEPEDDADPPANASAPSSGSGASGTD